ncbi:hypothetical protein H8356DRAFT_969928 [Neocallimastix lanati (nom. inval.)]|nr:hypothetical protein H8356DRAFT_969928 [Neocallimastix sp. JGI-2020a]
MDIQIDLMGNIVAVSNGYKICARSGMVNKISKRDSNNSCVQPVKFSFNNDIEMNTINILELFKEKNMDKNILPYYDNIDDISNPKVLHKNSEKISDLWKYLSQDYNKNFDKLTKEESSYYITGFYHTINQYKHLLAKSESSNNSYLVNFDENDIQEMESYFYNNYENHIKNFGDINPTINNDDNNDDNDDNNNDNDNEDNMNNIDESDSKKLIHKYNISNEPDSKNSKLKLIRNLENLLNIVNCNES